MKSLDDYAGIIGGREVERLRDEAEALEEKSVAHVSSTFYGGGVSEMLSSLIALLNDVGVKTEWRIHRGSPDFFAVTKKIHNALQGDNSITLNEKERKLYEGTAAENTRFTSLEGYDCVVVHDPQPAPLIGHYPRKLPWMFKPLPVVVGLKYVQKKQPWIWRCHVDLSAPNMRVWRYVRKFVRNYDAVITSSEKYRTGVRKPHFIVRPAIDPLSAKNAPMSASHAERMLRKFGIPLDKPIIAQVSRFDPWKDPVGVIDAFRLVRRKADCRLVLLGNTATDDPEGDVVFRKVLRAAEGDADIDAISTQNEELVNAVQSTADVIIQKSLREGFGLVVTEALWKAKPVVAGNVGGIPLQVIDGKDGFLVNSVEECAKKTEWLLKHPKEAKLMGAFGKEHVRRNFLVPRLLGDYLSLFKKTMAVGEPLLRKSSLSRIPLPDEALPLLLKFQKRNAAKLRRLLRR